MNTKETEQYTWVRSHVEAAKRLLEYRECSSELVDLLQQMQEEGLKAMPFMDQDAEGTKFPLEEIDPFTFLANFNRGVTVENRRSLWRFLKEKWGLTADVPDDFHGLPVANLQNSWLMPYKAVRKKEHVPRLWEFYAHVLRANIDSLDLELMDRCIDLKMVGLTNLSMGMFWARPDTWVAADKKNVGFGQTLELGPKPGSASDYQKWAKEAIKAADNDVISFSRKAHLWSIGRKEPDHDAEFGSPFELLFDDRARADSVLDQFRSAILELQEDDTEKEATLTTSLLPISSQKRAIGLNYGKWAILRYRSDGQWQVLLTSKFAATLTGNDVGGFRDLIEGVQYTLISLNAKTFTRNDVQQNFKNSLTPVRECFSKWKGSAFASSHRPRLFEAMVHPDRRGQILAEGIEDVAPNPGSDRPIWLIAPGKGAEHWDSFHERGMIGIGWNETGDLSVLTELTAFRDAVSKFHPDSGPVKVGRMLYDFVREMQPGDLIIVKEGRKAVVGWGIVQSDYAFEAKPEPFAHVRRVDWRESRRVELIEGMGLPTKTLTRLAADDRRVRYLRELHDFLDEGLGGTITPYTREDALADLFVEENRLDRMLALLRRRKNLILQGAPGTGKTFIARRLAYLLMGERDCDRAPMVQFHQSTSYEDFVQGFRPDSEGHFLLRNGVFHDFCRQATENPDADHVFIIDEINRGNLSKIFGELMMLIEPDKRERQYAVRLAYGDADSEPFHVPPNLHLIGTMNTADRSLSLVDYALRRRFAFIEMEPGFASPKFSDTLTKAYVSAEIVTRIRSVMNKLNLQIEEDTVNLGRGYRIGHSFFVPTGRIEDDKDWYRQVIDFEILPLVEEYWGDDQKALAQAKDLLGA